MSSLMVVAWVVLAVLAALSLLFLVTFLVERERRPALVTLLGSALFLGPFAALLLADFEGRRWVVLGMLAVMAVSLLVVVLVKSKSASLVMSGTPERVDERDAVFHRFYRIQAGTPEWNAYYARHPEKIDFDDKVRAKPPLAGPGQPLWDYHNGWINNRGRVSTTIRQDFNESHGSSALHARNHPVAQRAPLTADPWYPWPNQSGTQAVASIPR
jgi:hypothetical protein